MSDENKPKAYLSEELFSGTRIKDAEASKRFAERAKNALSKRSSKTKQDD